MQAPAPFIEKFYTNRTLVVRTFPLLLVGAGIGWFAATHADSLAATYFERILVKGAGWAAVALLAACAIKSIQHLFRRGPAIVIDERGIDDRTGFGLIPWPEVRGARVVSGKSGWGASLYIGVDHPGTYFDRLPVYRRPLARANGASRGGGHIMLNFVLLSPGADEALTCIKRYLRISGFVGPARCHACGYDLRASPERCPECGEPILEGIRVTRT